MWNINPHYKTSLFRSPNEDFIGFYTGFLILVVHWKREFERYCILFSFFVVVQVQLSAFSLHHFPLPQPSPPPCLDATPLGFVHVSFLVVPENPPPLFLVLLYQSLSNEVKVLLFISVYEGRDCLSQFPVSLEQYLALNQYLMNDKLVNGVYVDTFSTLAPKYIWSLARDFPVQNRGCEENKLDS